jgi:ribosomal protein S19E (S16A)
MPTNFHHLAKTGSLPKLVRLLFYIIAAVVRQIYISQSKALGVGTLKRMFGMRKRRGRQPPKFATASGKILRTIVKQLRDIGYVENRVLVSEEDQKKRTLGLSMTKAGFTELDKVASRILRGK